MALTTILCTFAYQYKRGHSFSIPARTDLKQKGLCSIQNSDSFKLCHKVVCAAVSSLQARLSFSLFWRRQNGVDFDEVGISSQRKGILLQSFINFHYSSRPFFWWYCLEDWVHSFCVWIIYLWNYFFITWLYN